jgi:hypothetical protein
VIGPIVMCCSDRARESAGRAWRRPRYVGSWPARMQLEQYDRHSDENRQTHRRNGKQQAKIKIANAKPVRELDIPHRELNAGDPKQHQADCCEADYCKQPKQPAPPTLVEAQMHGCRVGREGHASSVP